MYLACRHIKPNGLRCKSPALLDHAFCYYHVRLHNLSRQPQGKFAPIRLPVPEDDTSIQLSVAQISDALINDRIDAKRAGRLLYALQIAAQTIDRKKEFSEGDTVPSATQTIDGDDLAPELRICNKDEKCEECPHAKDCPNYHEYVEEVDEGKALLKALTDLGKHLDDPSPAQILRDMGIEPGQGEKDHPFLTRLTEEDNAWEEGPVAVRPERNRKKH